MAEQPVKKGEFILMGIASANRDELVHDDPDVFGELEPIAALN